MIANPTPTRQPIGWVSMFLMLGLLLATNLWAYFQPLTEEEQVKRAVAKFHVARRLENLGDARALVGETRSRGGSRRPSENYVRELDGIAERVRPYRATDPEAAALRIMVRVEQGAVPDPEDLKGLARDNDPYHLALRRIYTSEALSPKELPALFKEIRGDGVLEETARDHARAKAGIVLPQATPAVRERFATLGVLAAGCVAGALLLWGLYFSRRAKGLWRPRGLATGPISAYAADALAARSAQLFGLFLGSSVLATLLTVTVAKSGDKSPIWVEALTVVGLLAAIPLLFRTRVFGFAVSLRSVGLRMDEFGRDAVWGAAGALANVPIILLVAAASQTLFRSLPEPTHPLTEELAVGADGWRFVVLLAQAVILAPILEELVFRGTFFPALARVFRSVPSGILLSSFLFAAIHPQGVAGWPPLFVVGAMAAMLSHQRGSLVPAIAMHAVHNLAVMLASFLLF
ncbi:MAG: CPBP family intramembrane metalloprotease [Fimbriimonadaceae bacterium]|nr:CPBP family intramembrane metalloprotease [Fimbriimonadaceae bacterium]